MHKQEVKYFPEALPTRPVQTAPDKSALPTKTIQVLDESDPNFNTIYGQALVAHYPIIGQLWNPNQEPQS